jgi:DNA replication protein DnaC
MMTNLLLQRAKALKLMGLIAHWEEVCGEDWIAKLIEWEEKERTQRSLSSRLKLSRIGRFKPLAEFNWQWPKVCDRLAIEEFINLSFMREAMNIILCGPNGLGKSMIAQNIAYQAVLHGHTALFTTAGHMLGDLSSQDGDLALKRKLKFYTSPKLLVIDEVGYLSYSNRYADLLFEVISRRYEKASTIVTTNKPFSEWRDIFPNAACVVSLIDRLVHRSEIINIEGDSYRLNEAMQASAGRKASREKNKSTKQAKTGGITL